MLKNFHWSNLLVVGLFCCFIPKTMAVTCAGKFPNPVTDICWNCLFPIQMGSVEMTGSGQRDNNDPAPPFICSCPAPPPIMIRFGVGVSYWEPARIAEVVRTPMCSPTLNGTVLGRLPVPAGTHDNDSSFYHVHWFQYPVLSWLGMGIQSMCGVSETFDLAFMSELDPFWDSAEWSNLFSPEVFLFTNPIAQAACMGDAAMAAVTGFGLDTLFWCSGSQGSVYPICGHQSYHQGGIDASLAIVHKAIFKLHRMGIAQDTSTPAAMCGSVIQPILRKKQYKQQMLYPVSQTKTGHGLGVPSIFWGAGREFPYKGEDFSYLMWRKRSCCAL